MNQPFLGFMLSFANGLTFRAGARRAGGEGGVRSSICLWYGAISKKEVSTI